MDKNEIPFLEGLIPSELSEKDTACALAALEKHHWPTRKDENWKYTNLNKIKKKSYSRVSETKLTSFKIPFSGYKLVFENGNINLTLSNIPDKDGITVQSLQEARTNDLPLFTKYYDKLVNVGEDPFGAINTAYLQNGWFVHVSKKATLDQPLHIVNIITENSSLAITRNLIVVEDFAELEVVTTTHTTENVKDAVVMEYNEVYVGQNSKYTNNKFQTEGTELVTISSEEVKQDRDSNYTSNTFSFTGKLIRNNIHINVDGENCHTEMNGLFFPSEKQLIDNHTLLRHNKSHCTSSELYKGVVSDKAIGVFNGKVIVAEDAQKIEAYQQNNNIVVDEGVINAKPELEIYADDVRCSHGTTTGQFDETAMFYLQARGVSEKSARKMLVNAFAFDVIEKLENDELKAFAEEQVLEVMQ